MLLRLALIGAAIAAATLLQAQMTAPPSTTGVTEMHDQFLSSTDSIEKGKLLDQISGTPAANTRDVQSLFDIFMRFPDAQARGAVLNSLDLIGFQNEDLDELLVHYLQQPEPEAKVFAIKGAVRVRDAAALPLIEKLAKGKIRFHSSKETVLLSEKTEWWVHYEALSALAKWEGEKAIPLIIKKSGQAPEVTGIMGALLWKQSLPYFVKWAGSSSRTDQDRAHAGLSAVPPGSDLRATRDQMLTYLRDPKAPRELRHQLAKKIGQSSTHEEVAGLLKEYEALTAPDDKLMYLAALFSSGDKLVVPLLAKTAKEDPSPLNRAGALVELKDLLSAEEMRPYWEWTSQNDPDDGNREIAARELKLLPKAEKN
jgi:hypothetical protein